MSTTMEAPTPAPAGDNVTGVVQRTTTVNITIVLSNLSTFDVDGLRTSLAAVAEVAEEDVSIQDSHVTAVVEFGSPASVDQVREMIATATGEGMGHVMVVQKRRLAAGRLANVENTYEARVEASSTSAAQSDMASVSNATALEEILGQPLTILDAPHAEVSSTVAMVTTGANAISPPTVDSLRKRLQSDLGVDVDCAMSEAVFTSEALDTSSAPTPAPTPDDETISYSRMCAQVSLATVAAAVSTMLLRF